MYELEAALAEEEEPHLENPPVEQLLELAGITQVEDVRSRSAMLAAMRKAAEKRLAGVVENKRRCHYDHAALLATASAVLDEEAAGQAWLAAMRVRHNRYPALQREFDRLGV